MSVTAQHGGSVSIGGWYSLEVPPGWTITRSYDRLPLRLQNCGRIRAQAPNGEPAFCILELSNCLAGQPAWDDFLHVLATPGTCQLATFQKLYPALLAVPPAEIFKSAVVDHPVLGRALEIKYSSHEVNDKGHLLYARLPESSEDIVICGYEGKEPAYSHRLYEAGTCLNSLARMDAAGGDALDF